MLAKARHWVNYNGTWHCAGEEFEIDAKDADEMKAYAEITQCDEPKEPEPTETAQAEPVQAEPVQAQPKRGRKRKTDD